jgi:NSS family neurotransmitter:Na+ symporter
MPVLLLVILFLVYQASQTSGWEEAKAFFFTIDSQRLLSRDLWVAAFGQAFYTLCVPSDGGAGYGIGLESHAASVAN